MVDDDYISPDLEAVSLDSAFPDMIVGTKSANQWPYLRREIAHHWYVDRRNPTVGFLSRDEAMLLYNIARQHFGRPCLEIGCWRGWSTAHMALGAGNLEVIDPVLADPGFRDDVAQSLQRASVLGSVVLHAGPSPDIVVRLSEETGKRWALVFIDGDHEDDAPRLDAEVVHRYADEDATILLHDLTSPYVATALAWLRDHGWTTAVYQTMQIMGIAVRGVDKPVAHLPDPRQPWTLPRHLASFPVIGETRAQRLRRIVADLEGQPPEPGTTSELDALSDVDARALDALLVRAAGSLEQQHEVATAFDELQARYLRLLDRFAAREAEPDPSSEFARLQVKHLEVLSRTADLEAQLHAAHREAEVAAGRLCQQQEAAREFARLQAKHFEVLSRTADLEVQLHAAHREAEVVAGRLRQEQEAAREFVRLQAKHLEALSRAADLEAQLHAVHREAEVAAGRLRQQQEAARDLTVERDLLTKMLDRVQRKHVEVLGQLCELQMRRSQADLQPEEARGAFVVGAQALIAKRPVELRVAIDRFAYWMSRKRILFGLSRRLLAGRKKEVQRLVEHNLRASGVPDSLIPAAIWLAKPRVVLGLARRRALADMVSLQGLLVLSLERSFDISWVGTHQAVSNGSAAVSEFDRLRRQVGELEGRLTATQKRFDALEAAKIADEKALLEADLAIARLRQNVGDAAS